MLTAAELIEQGLLDSGFPYPLAFETCYNLASQFYGLLILMLVFVIVLLVGLFISVVLKYIGRIMGLCS